jgi:hypothetical protein
MKYALKPLLPLFTAQTILVTRAFRSRLKVLLPLSLLLLAAWCVPSPTRAFADAGNLNPGILPPQASAFGRTYGAWSAAWWQYVLAQPTATNPLLDSTGANCRMGQSGPVFFLVGTIEASGTATRECTVPAGKALFFPLVNTFASHVECAGGIPSSFCDSFDTPAKVWVNLLQPSFSPSDNIRDATSELQASIDGVYVHDLNHATTPYRACVGPSQFGCKGSPAFSITLPDDNLFGIPAGVYGPAVADGFFLLLAPLNPGPHTITCSGTSVFTTQEITYHLLVSPS